MHSLSPAGAGCRPPVTQAVMLVSPVERRVASASYGFVRFIGGGLAPYFASRMASAWNVHIPFWVAAGSEIIAIAVLASGHSILTRAEQTALAHPEPVDDEAIIEAGDVGGFIPDEAYPRDISEVEGGSFP